MLRHKNIDRVCCVILALTLLATTVFVGAAATGTITGEITMGYETRLFDQSRVHTIDIVMDDWDAFVETATNEEYAACHLIIDGESYKNVAIRGKGNTSLTSVKSYGNNRYSFKVEFDHYQTGSTYHGLDKLSLNNLIQDNTYMKDYIAYTLMNKMGVAAPMCSFVQINVNGEPWGLYLAVEGVEDSFLQRNYGKNYGELYKPDSMSFGGGRGNGRDFDMDEAAEKFGFSFGEEDGDASSFTMPDMSNMPQMPDMGGANSFGGEMPDMSGSNPFGGEMPDMSGSNPFGGEMPDTSGSNPFGGEMPDMSSSNPFGGEMPDMSGSNPFGGEMPDMGGANSFSGQMPDMGGANPFGGEMPDMSGSNPFGGEMPNMGGANPFGGEMPDMSGSNPFGGQMPDMSGANPFGGEMPDMSGFNPFGGEASDADSAAGESKSRSMGGFGGFGMGSNDVKLVYSDDDPASYTNIFNNAKTDITAADQARLIASLKALGEGDVSVVDTDAVIRYMAVHNFLCNDDSYTGMMVHNYYLYEEDGVLSMIPWDYNLAFGGFSGGNATSTVNTSISRLVSMGNDSDRPMAGWITASEEYTAQYLAAYAELMTAVFDSGWFAQEIDRVTSLIAPYVQNDPTAFCTYEEFQTGVETLKQFCLKRAESVKRQLNGETANVDASELNLSAMGSMGNMGGGGPGGMGFPGGDFSRSGKGRESRQQSGEETAESADTVKQSNAFTPPNAEGWKDMPGMQPAEAPPSQGIWLAVCTALLLAAVLLVWRYPNKR